MKFDNTNPFYSASVEVYVVNSQDYQDFFIGDIYYSTNYDDGLLEMMNDDILELVSETVIKELYQAPTDGTKYVVQTDFQYHFYTDYWDESDIDMANRYQILSSKKCDFDEEYAFYEYKKDPNLPEEDEEYSHQMEGNIEWMH